MKSFVIIYGKSGTGKNYISDLFGFKRVISHTTRPKREYEINGSDYFFVTDEQSILDMASKITLAEEKIGKYMYYSTISDIGDSESYIVGYQGAHDFIKVKNKFKDKTIVIMYIKSPIHKRIKRMLARGDSKKSILMKLVREFFQYKDIKYDVLICN